MVFLVVSITIIIFILYKRYFPVFGVSCIPMQELHLDRVMVIDLRDYNVSYDAPIKGANNIPIAYLKRNIYDIPNRNLHLVVSSSLEKNIGIRLLRQKGFRVVGYTIIEQTSLFLKENPLKIKMNS